MKNIITLIAILSLFACKAQSPIISIEDWDGSEQQNAYYKDTNNLFNNFEGTWLYTNGNTSLKITLVKITMFFNGDYYEDMLIGGYQYIEDGIEEINTLTDANDISLGYQASINGTTIFNSCLYLPVDDCVDGEKRLGLSIDDVTSDGHYGRLVLHKRVVNGQEALKINIEMNYVGPETGDGNIPEPTLPWQIHDIVLIKQ